MNNSYDKYMRQCFKLAKKGTGYVSPNPLVGAVIVKNNEVISEGFHPKYGQPHAEANAIKNTTKDLHGATIYCNLEPCRHTNKQTPPCVPRIIESGISKVVISNVDPNPSVAGEGIKQLQNAGIEVVHGILEEEGKYLNKFFFKHIKTGLPYITIKIARSIDGKVAAKKGEQTWLTGDESKRYVHSLRAEYDAVLIGANTVKIDNPQLTVRLVDGRSPKRVIIDGSLSSPEESLVLNDQFKELTIVFTKKNVDSQKVTRLKGKGIEIIQLEEDKNGRLSLQEIIKTLGLRKINSVLVEGGAEIFKQFASHNLFDEMIILEAPVLLKDGVDSLVAPGSLNLQLLSEELLGKDTKRIYKNSN